MTTPSFGSRMMIPSAKIPPQMIAAPYPNRLRNAFDHAAETVASADTLISERKDITPKTISTIAAISSPHGGRLSSSECHDLLLDRIAFGRLLLRLGRGRRFLTGFCLPWSLSFHRLFSLCHTFLLALT